MTSNEKQINDNKYEVVQKNLKTKNTQISL